MKYIIIPLDFSLTSLNAAHYAAEMYKTKEDVTLILYHFYNHANEKETAQKYLKSLQQELIGLGCKVKIELDSGEKFIERLAAFAFAKKAFMIVMGIKEKSTAIQRFYGSNVLLMCEQEICPILIIPENAVYTGISNALITSELRFVEETPSLLTLKNVLGYFKPAIHVLNVDPDHYISPTEKYNKEKEKMEALLVEFDPSFYFMNLYDFHEAVEALSKSQNIDMIAIAPKYHNFFGKLFKTLHTKKLLYNNKVPVLAIHE